MNSRLIGLNKPYGVICQFSPHKDHPTLADYVTIPDVYPAGRLDTDSEGLLLLTADGALQHRIADPRHKLEKCYWVQVEGAPDTQALRRLTAGVDLGDFVTQPCKAYVIDEPAGLWPRSPPIRVRKAIPTTWVEIRISEGKNRQIRRMTAKCGWPTLRLIRHAIGPFHIGGLAPGKYCDFEATALGRTSRQPPRTSSRLATAVRQ